MEKIINSVNLTKIYGEKETVETMDNTINAPRLKRELSTNNTEQQPKKNKIEGSSNNNAINLTHNNNVINLT